MDEPRKNSNEEQLVLLIVTDSQATGDGIKLILKTPPNDYVFKMADNFADMKTQLENNKIGMLLFSIVNNKEWFNRLIAMVLLGILWGAK